MEQAKRAMVYDTRLQIEACFFSGLMQPFPTHFHEYYVIGLVERGQRALTCRNRDYTIGAGDILLFSPGDSHGCAQTDGGTLEYRSIHVKPEVMLALAAECTGQQALPAFPDSVIRDGEAAGYLRDLHELVMTEGPVLCREERWRLLVSLLLERYGAEAPQSAPRCRDEVARACTFMETHLEESISLEMLCDHTGLSKSTLLRAFVREKGVTPYRYLENIRVGEAKKLLAQGVPPVEAALRTGFSDQSHFTVFFSRFIGLPPGAYRGIFSEQRETEENSHGA